MVLVDTSVWVDHFRKFNVVLAQLLKDSEVVVHPFVIGELACGNLKRAGEILNLLRALAHVPRISDEEILVFIEGHQISGRGLGLVDVHLLASCLIDNTGLWTGDKKLQIMAEKLGIGYQPNR